MDNRCDILTIIELPHHRVERRVATIREFQHGIRHKAKGVHPRAHAGLAVVSPGEAALTDSDDVAHQVADLIVFEVKSHIIKDERSARAVEQVLGAGGCSNNLVSASYVALKLFDGAAAKAEIRDGSDDAYGKRDIAFRYGVDEASIVEEARPGDLCQRGRAWVSGGAIAVLTA